MSPVQEKIKVPSTVSAIQLKNLKLSHHNLGSTALFLSVLRKEMTSYTSRLGSWEIQKPALRPIDFYSLSCSEPLLGCFIWAFGTVP
jgi:hypothetical protein